MMSEDTKIAKPEEFLKIHDQFLNKCPKATLLRVIYVSLLGVTALFLIVELLDITHIYNKYTAIITAILGINLLSEGNIIINRYLDYKLPWFKHLTKRIRVQLLASFAWLLTINSIYFIVAPRSVSKESVIIFVFGTFFILMFNSILFMRSFAFNWRQSLIENEQLKQAKLHADYMALQNQLNPHFLFNSFSALISEIQYNPKRAVEFAQKMSDVYRYVLKQKDNTTVELKNEMEFLEDYCYLHKIRMGENLVLNMEIEAVQLNMHLPPMTIQALIENAIKHNKASEKLPLYITIKSEPNGRLSVVNNLNPKSNEYSTGTGLDNICKRYKLLSNELVEIKTEDEKFIVSLPLLNK